MDGWNLDDLIGNDPKARERIRKADKAAGKGSDNLSSQSSLRSQSGETGRKASDPAASDDLSSLKSLLSQPCFPKPLEKAAYHGLIGEIVRFIQPETEADPAAILIQLLTMVGNAVGRGPYFKVEGDRHATNLFAVIVGKTSKGRKGTSYGRAKQLLDLAEPGWASSRIGHGLSSGEGLIAHVRDPVTRTETDKKGGTTQEVLVDAGVTDKRLMVVEAEFASTLRVMQREGNTLSPVIRQAWDGGRLQTMTKNSPLTATGALVSIIGHITADELRRNLDRTEAANGFANRFLFVAAKRSQLLPNGGRDLDFGPYATRLAAVLETARHIGQVCRTDAATRVWRKFYPKLSAERPGMLGAITGRAEGQVIRLSLLYALLDGQAFVDVEHFEAALAVWRYSEASAKWIFGDSQGDPVADEIMRALRARPEGMTRTDMRDLFDRHASSSNILRALHMLFSQGLVEVRKVRTGGRPAEIWSLKEDRDKSDFSDESPPEPNNGADFGSDEADCDQSDGCDESPSPPNGQADDADFEAVGRARFGKTRLISIHDHAAVEEAERAGLLTYIGNDYTDPETGRHWPQSIWGNPFPVKRYGRAGAIQRYRDRLPTQPELLVRLPELCGRVMACHCAPKPCHGDVLLEHLERQP
jgi:hypothetical protein